MLLEEEKSNVLKIMYFMNNIEKNKDLPRYIISYYFVLNSEKIKEIDIDFYNKIVENWVTYYESFINTIIKHYRKSIKYDDAQFCFYDLNKDDLKIDDKNQKNKILNILNIINNKEIIGGLTKPVINTYLLINKEEIRKINLDFYETRIRPLIEMDTSKLIDVVAKDYIDNTLNDGNLNEVVQISFNDYLNEKDIVLRKS